MNSLGHSPLRSRRSRLFVLCLSTNPKAGLLAAASLSSEVSRNCAESMNRNYPRENDMYFFALLGIQNILPLVFEITCLSRRL